MSKIDLHIISFDVPYPPNYGGAIDVFYKLKALSTSGISIHLHCFEKDRPPTSKLNEICTKVSYYKRSKSVEHFFGRLPYIVASRNSKTLLENLRLDKAPIFFEGIHSCFHLTDPVLKNRRKFVRMHNVENDYYMFLAQQEGNWFKKYYYQSEAMKLSHYQRILTHAQIVFCITTADQQKLQKEYADSSPTTFRLLEPFHSNDDVISLVGKGEYILYHGNLSINENDTAARFILENICQLSDYVFIIAGNNPSAKLRKMIAKHQNVSLKDDLDFENTQKLIQQAHIHVLPTFQPTGIKLKLINALCQGRFVLANSDMVSGTNMEHLCTIEETGAGMHSHIQNLMKHDFSTEEVDRRKQFFKVHFSNKANAEIIAAQLG